MSQSLRDFLHEHAAKHSAEYERIKAEIAEWRAAVDRLFAQILGWLQEADPEGIIRHELCEEKINEPGLGRYTIPRLDLRAFSKWIGIIPKARKTGRTAHPPQKNAPLQSTGRVDITDEIRRYVLYRFADESGEYWQMDDLISDTMVPFDRFRFEAALMSYFR